MEIVLTHEQTDFDAIASALAAWMLEPHRVLIIPKRINRNVKNFLKIYKDEFPFKFLDEVENTPITSILLTDTQSYNENPRFIENVAVRVIDHHQPGANLPIDWQCVFEPVGACTTILVEKIMTRDYIPEKIQCSLLLMGIYEDTGFLTYGSTTARDAYAAAWLIDHGADLDLIRHFLNQPLTENQQLLTDRLLQNCEQLSINDEQIVIAEADARDANDEFSTVAHHLRDMLSPDALLICLAAKSGIRVIARTTNDRIDVGLLMKRFNGGGHSRAAAGLIPYEEEANPLQTLEKVRGELISLLPDFVRPPLSVGQIMSKNPLTLSPETPFQKVVEIIDRYGYEGYPVIDSTGKLIGLLNRRSIDHARSHHLNLSLDDLMDSGSYSVKVTDSVGYLQEMMSLSGWGQIPVVDEDEKTIVGIVTRTDLITTLSDQKENSMGKNLSQELLRVLPKASRRLIEMTAKTAESCGYPVYIVGGFVRDLLLGCPVMDFDIVVEGDAIHLCKTLVNVYGGKMRTHSQFGTAKWMIHSIHDVIDSEMTPDSIPDSLDLISARTEFYDYPTALPKVERSSIKLDLHRRDFTINTMAIRLDGKHFGELLDNWGGYQDLQRKIIRVLHSLSFSDDPTRMLRAVRFEQRFGFTIEPHTLKLIQSTQGLLKQVSGRRVMHELDLFFHEDNPSEGLYRLQSLGILRQIHPELKWTAENAEDLDKLKHWIPDEFWKETFGTQMSEGAIVAPYTIWWKDYSDAVINELTSRLKMSNKMAKIILGTGMISRCIPDYREKWASAITEFFETIPIESLAVWYFLTPEENDRFIISEFMTKWRHCRPVTTGDDLKKMGYGQGPWIAAVLKRLRRGWIDGEFNTAADEQLILQKVLPDYLKANPLRR